MGMTRDDESARAVDPGEPLPKPNLHYTSGHNVGLDTPCKKEWPESTPDGAQVRATGKADGLGKL